MQCRRRAECVLKPFHSFDLKSFGFQLNPFCSASSNPHRNTNKGPVSSLLHHSHPLCLGLPAKFRAFLCLAPMQIKQSVSNVYIVINTLLKKTLVGVVKSIRLSLGFVGRASSKTRVWVQWRWERAFLIACLESFSLENTGNRCTQWFLWVSSSSGSSLANEHSSGRPELYRGLFPMEGGVLTAIPCYTISAASPLLLPCFLPITHLFLFIGCPVP